MSRPRLIVVGPLPPPVHGVTVSTGLVLANPRLRELFDVEHLDTSDHRDGQNVGRWDVTNVRIGVANVGALLMMLRGRRGVIYLPISQSSGAFLRDSLFIRLAAARRWNVTIHLRGSELMPFYERSGGAFRYWARGTLRRVTSAAVMGETLRDAFGTLVPRGRVVVVPNGTPVSSVTGIQRDPLQVLFLSNLRRRKGVVESVEAARIVLDQIPAARFVFAGAWEDDQLRRELMARCIGLADRIKFLPGVSRPETHELLASSGVLLFPPREPEGHPRVVLEAIAAGLPVVATDRGAITETVEHGVSGFVHPDPDPDALASYLIQILTDPDLYARMSHAARERYRANFTQERADERLAYWLSEVSRQ